jgi:hypothetical protein
MSGLPRYCSHEVPQAVAVKFKVVWCISWPRYPLDRQYGVLGSILSVDGLNRVYWVFSGVLLVDDHNDTPVHMNILIFCGSTEVPNITHSTCINFASYTFSHSIDMRLITLPIECPI